MTDTPKEHKRSCGACTLCCKLLGVLELDKPAGTWCDHCTPGRGCKIYEGRPLSCEDFECGWLLSNLPLQFRPDYSHMIITGDVNKLNAVVIHMDPKYPKAFETPVGKKLIDIFMRNNKSVILIIGDKRKLLSTNSEDIKTLQETIKQMDVSNFKKH